MVNTTGISAVDVRLHKPPGRHCCCCSCGFKSRPILHCTDAGPPDMFLCLTVHCMPLCRPPAGKRAAPEHGRDLLDLVPPPKLPRCASASSVLQRPAAAAKAARRTGSGRTASVTALAAAAAAGRPRKRAGGGRGTGPLAATLPGQHCQYCHTQVGPRIQRTCRITLDAPAAQ